MVAKEALEVKVTTFSCKQEKDQAIHGEVEYDELARTPFNVVTLTNNWLMYMKNKLQDEEESLKRERKCIGVVVVVSKTPYDAFGCLFRGRGAWINSVRASSSAIIWNSPRDENHCVANIASARLLTVTADSADEVMDVLQKIVPKLAEEACAIAERLAR